MMNAVVPPCLCKRSLPPGLPASMHHQQIWKTIPNFAGAGMHDVDKVQHCRTIPPPPLCVKKSKPFFHNKSHDSLNEFKTGTAFDNVRAEDKMPALINGDMKKITPERDSSTEHAGSVAKKKRVTKDDFRFFPRKKTGDS